MTKTKSMSWGKSFENVSMRDVIRKGFAVAAGLFGTGFAGFLWAGCVGMFLSVGESLGYLLGGMIFAGIATFASFGVCWFVWAVWTDEL